jgi:hypothetical protein
VSERWKIGIGGFLLILIPVLATHAISSLLILRDSTVFFDPLPLAIVLIIPVGAGVFAGLRAK